MKKQMMLIFLLGLLSSLLCSSSCHKGTSPPSIKTGTDTLSFSVPVFTSGEGGYSSYRIPAIIKAPDGSLLAFVEGRVESSADFGNVKILMKKSLNNGKTWGPALLVAENNDLQAGNPTPVVDYTDTNYPQGRVFLFYCTGNNTQGNVTNLKGVREVWYTVSTDNGDSWSKPVNITLQVHHPYQPAFNPAYSDPMKWTAYATGPCHAIQITEGSHKGRLVVPINHGIYSNKTNYAAVFYTDDHGETFHLSPDVPLQSDETTVAELPGGGLLLNSRDQYLGKHRRILSYDSTGNLDNTTIWQSSFNAFLPGPVCQGSMINDTNSNHEALLLFCNPTSTTTRSQLGLRQSFDWGKSWTAPFILSEGFGGYSDIVILPEWHIGVLYEADNYKTIQFKSVQYDVIPQK